MNHDGSVCPQSAQLLRKERSPRGILGHKDDAHNYSSLCTKPRIHGAYHPSPWRGNVQSQRIKNCCCLVPHPHWGLKTMKEIKETCSHCFPKENERTKGCNTSRNFQIRSWEYEVALSGHIVLPKDGLGHSKLHENVQVCALMGSQTWESRCG